MSEFEFIDYLEEKNIPINKGHVIQMEIAFQLKRIADDLDKMIK